MIPFSIGIRVYSIQMKRPRTVDVYGILGEGISEKHDPPVVEVSDEPRIVIPWKTPGDVRLEWVMMPLKGDPESGTFDPLKKLLIYEHPEEKATYSVGVDPGTGVGGDRTAIAVTKTGRDAHPDKQVAEFASDDISNVEIYIWVAAITAYYGQYMEDEQPRIVIEQRRKYGDSCYHALKLHGFRNHHKFREYDKKTLRPIQRDNQREGWFTNAWSRPLLLGMFKYAVDGGWFEVSSKWLLEEIEGFEQKTTESGTTRMDHMQGKHDNRIFAAAMSYFTLHDMDVMAERAKKKYNADVDEDVKVDLRPWYPVIENRGAAGSLRLPIQRNAQILNSRVLGERDWGVDACSRLPDEAVSGMAEAGTKHLERLRRSPPLCRSGVQQVPGHEN